MYLLSVVMELKSVAIGRTRHFQHELQAEAPPLEPTQLLFEINPSVQVRKFMKLLFINKTHPTTDRFIKNKNTFVKQH